MVLLQTYQWQHPKANGCTRPAREEASTYQQHELHGCIVDLSWVHLTAPEPCDHKEHSLSSDTDDFQALLVWKNFERCCITCSSAIYSNASLFLNLCLYLNGVGGGISTALFAIPSTPSSSLNSNTSLSAFAFSS